MRFAVTAVLVASGLAFAGCSEKPQTAGQRKVDQQVWQKPDTAYVTGDWKAGDRDSWEAQVTRRAQAQNEYARINP